MADTDNKENKTVDVLQNAEKTKSDDLKNVKTTAKKDEELQKKEDSTSDDSSSIQKAEKLESQEKLESKEKNNLKEKQAPPADKSVSVTADKISAKDLKVAEIINDIKNEIFIGDQIKSWRSFDIVENAVELDKDFLIEVRSSFFHNEATISSGQKFLTENHIVILCGPERAGKFCLSQYLAANLIIEGEAINKNVMVVEALPFGFMFDLNYLLQHTESLKDKIIIFKESIANGNPSVLNFLRSLGDINGPAKTKSGLNNRNSYLIFTISDDTISPDASFIKELSLKMEVPIPESEFLAKAFAQKMNAYCFSKGLNPNEIIQNLKNEKPNLVALLGTMHGIATFVQNHLDSILAKRKSIDEAIRQNNDLTTEVTYWYKKGICDTLNTNQDFECWVFLFCLAFLDRSPWLQFERFYRDIAQKIFRELHPLSDIKKLGFMLSEDPILSKCRARIMKDISSGKELVKFLDSNYSLILSRLIINSNKRIISVVLEYIDELVDNPDYQNIPLVCRMLGRIGIIAPDYTVFKYIRKWALKESYLYRKMVADVYQGIGDSQDEHYIKRAMSLLHSFALSDNLNERVTAIFVFKNLAEQDIVLCMNELRRIAEQCIGRLHDVKLFDENVRNLNDIMGEITKRLAEIDYLLPIIQYTLVYICIEHDSVNVIDEMRKWLLSREIDCVMLTVFFFLNKDGIADALEYLEKDIPRDNRQNRLITLFWNTNRATMIIINFIRELFSSIESMPSIYHKQFKESLFCHLKTWVEISFENDANWDPLSKFIRNLYKTGQRELKEAITYEILNWRLPDQRQGLKGFLAKIKEEIAEFEKS